MSKFKIGDRVKFSGKHIPPELSRGKSYEILEISNGWHRVITDRGSVNGWIESSWELADSSPVRTRTVKEIVPGVYDGVRVKDHPEGVFVRIGGIATGDPGRLRAAATVLTQLAEALEG